MMSDIKSLKTKTGLGIALEVKAESDRNLTKKLREEKPLIHKKSKERWVLEDVVLKQITDLRKADELECRLNKIRKLAQKIKECQESQCVLAPERITPNCPNTDCPRYWDLTEELAVLLKEGEEQ